MRGQKALEPVVVRPGVPQYGLGLAFEQTITEHYAWGKLAKAEINRASAMAFLPGYPHPVQALMQRELGECLPICASLHQPLTDRPIEHAAIWYSGDDYYSAMEAEAVAAVLNAAGIGCEVMCGQEKKAEDFLAVYREQNIDLLWVAGHGQCDRWNPKSPAILAGAADPILIDDLATIRMAGESRRLLVLNICDSGAASVMGGMHKIGLAPMLASSHQAVIGHAWPVDPLVAAGFGVCLAKELVRGRTSFFVGFERAIRTLRQEWPYVVKHAGDGLEVDLIERLRRNERDLGNIFHWGSPCYFE